MSDYGQKPWLESYKLGPFKVAHTMGPYPDVPLYHFLDETVRKYGSRPAMSYLGGKITWTDLGGLIDRLATALQSLGVKKGDRVASILPTSPQYVIADFAIQKCGAAHVPCSLLHAQRDLVWEIGESGARTVICLDKALNLVHEVGKETSLENIIATSIKDFSPEQPGCGPNGVMWLTSLLEQAKAGPRPVDINPADDLAVLLFTGGATGMPKGVMLTHRNLVANTIQSLPWVMAPLQSGIAGKSSLLIAIPLFHSYGHWAVRTAVYWGLQMLLIPDPRDTASIAENLKKNRPFLAPLVPTQYMNLLETDLGRSNTSFASGAAPLPPEVARQFRKKTGMPITEAYGLTETSPVTHFNLSAFSKITGFMPFEKAGSIGVPVADTEVKVVAPDTGEEMPFGEVGEMYIKGPQVMKGYWPDAGQGLHDGWLATGDLCRMDQDGYFFLVDRNKDMINVSGNKVYSTTVDEVLYEHPAVAQAVTIGLPNPDKPGSEMVKAFVVLNKQAQGQVLGSEITEHCRQRLAAYAVPKLLEFRDELPMTVTGKLFKKKLRDEEMAKLTG